MGATAVYPDDVPSNDLERCRRRRTGATSERVLGCRGPCLEAARVLIQFSRYSRAQYPQLFSSPLPELLGASFLEPHVPFSAQVAEPSGEVEKRVFPECAVLLFRVSRLHALRCMRCALLVRVFCYTFVYVGL